MKGLLNKITDSQQFKDWTALCVFILLIDVIWTLLEYLLYGQKMGSLEDSIIGIAFAVSLLYNYKHHQEKR